MKKFFASIIFGLTLIFGGLPTVAAQDVYIESEYGGGRDIYVVTESIDKNGRDYVNVTLKFLRGNSLVDIEHRKYAYVEAHGMWYKNSEEGIRNKLRPAKVWNIAEDKVLMYCLTYR